MKAIIIGATSGIGKEMAVRLIAEGWETGLAGRRIEELEAIKSASGKDSVHIAKIDVTNFL